MIDFHHTGRRNRNSWEYAGIAIIPIVLFVTGVIYIHSMGLYFRRSVDPEYAYLFNGLLIANLKFDVQFINHPGTPVQCLVAIVLRVFHLFRPGQSLTMDVLQNPEFYIRSILYTFNVLNAAAVLLLGYFTFLYSKNLVIAVFLQMAPLTNILTLEVLPRIMPETLMTIIICGWITVMIKMIIQHQRELNYNKYSLILGLLFGLSLSDKLTFLPFFLLPLIILPAWKHRIMYVGYSVFFFMLFAFPVTLNFNLFIRWVTMVFIHTGAYGSGDRGILKWNDFLDHFRLQLTSTELLFISVILLLLVIVIVFINERKKKTSDSILIRISLAVIIVVFLEYLMAAKQFAYHYMIPSTLLITFIILLIFLLLNRLIPGGISTLLMNSFLGLLGVLIIISIVPQSVQQVRQIRNIAETGTAAYRKIEPFMKHSPRIICPSYYGCSAVEYALIFGIHESGRYGDFLFKKIKEIYPGTYLYFPWGKVFYEGEKEILPEQIIKPDILYYLYIADFTDERLKELVGAMLIGSEFNDYSLSQLFYEAMTAEAIYSFKTGKGDD